MLLSRCFTCFQDKTCAEKFSAAYYHTYPQAVQNYLSGFKPFHFFASTAQYKQKMILTFAADISMVSRLLFSGD